MLFYVRALDSIHMTKHCERSVSDSPAVDVRVMPNMEDKFVYEPLPGERWVRVLILEPSLDTSQHLHATLEPLSIGEALPAVPRDGDTNYKDREADYHREWDARKLDYHALSYSWAMQNGDASFSHSMVLAGKVVNITRNLAEGLLNIRSATEPTRLWVDAVCIDQKNTAERGSQVAMMFDIYRMAVGVIIWLGNGATETEDFKIWEIFHSLAANEILRSDRWHVLRPAHEQVYMDAWDALLHAGSSKVCAPSKCCCLSDRSLGRRASPTQEKKSTQATFFQWCSSDKAKADSLAHSIRPIMPLLRRRYWTRRWVLQENLARDGHSGAGLYRWGRYAVNAGIVRKFLDVLNNIDGGRDEAEYLAGSRVMTEELRDFFSELRTLPSALYNTVYASGASMDLCRLLQRHSALQCADPRDHLYALIALDPTYDVQVDYDSSFRDVCIDLATKMIRKGDFRVLDVARYTQSDPSLELPSWVPSLHASWDAGPLTAAPLPATVTADAALVLETYWLGDFIGIDIKPRRDADRNDEIFSHEHSFTVHPHGISVGPADYSTHSNRLRLIGTPGEKWPPFVNGDRLFVASRRQARDGLLWLRPVDTDASTYRLVWTTSFYGVRIDMRMIRDFGILESSKTTVTII